MSSLLRSISTFLAWHVNIFAWYKLKFFQNEFDIIGKDLESKNIEVTIKNRPFDKRDLFKYRSSKFLYAFYTF